MADGALAIAFLVGAVARAFAPGTLVGDTDARLQIGLGDVLFQGEEIGAEVLGLLDLGPARPLQPVAGLSMGRDVGPWVGAGLRWTAGSERLWAEMSFLPGLYADGFGGPDLGLDLQFRSSLAVTYALESGVAFTVAVDHRSNGDLSDVNPGVETLSLRVSIPLR